METLPGRAIDVVVQEALSINPSGIFNVATTHFDWPGLHPEPRTA